MKSLRSALILLLTLSLLFGLIYPLAMTAVAYMAFRDKAQGSLIRLEGKLIGSRLIGQKFSSDRYFWPRPSAVDYNPLPSGGSNLGPTSAKLAQEVARRRESLTKAHGVKRDAYIPADLLFASASGLDPHISQSAAYFQIDRVMKARGWGEEMKKKAQDKIDFLIEHNPKVFPGEAGVNVLLLNLAMDNLQNE
jgi:K+-transporting ATPase ATPase C chain